MGIPCEPEMSASRCYFPCPFETCPVIATQRSRSSGRCFVGDLRDGLMSFLWVFYSLAAVLVIGLPCGLLQLAWGWLAGRVCHAGPTILVRAPSRS